MCYLCLDMYGEQKHCASYLRDLVISKMDMWQLWSIMKMPIISCMQTHLGLSLCHTHKFPVISLVGIIEL